MPISLNRWENTAQDRNFRNKTNENWDKLERTHNDIEDKSQKALSESMLAKDKANSAVEKANDSNSLAQNVQKQLDTIVASGDSGPEAAQARVGANGEEHDSLKSRLDAEFKKNEDRVSDIVIDLRLTEGADCTAVIQKALDKKGWIRIVSPGTFITGRLLIDSNTKLELMPGVNFKKKDGTNNYILVNRGHVYGYRNKNITLKGGSWNLNNGGNPNAAGDLSKNPQSWSGIGVLFNGIDNLTIEEIVDIGGEWKYCFLITDINQGKFRNINMNNESDGLHFQPPLKNIEIENISGITHDDLISFTMGDYPRYSLGQTGHIENVFVKNVYGGPTTDSLVKLVGSGLYGSSVFKNMKFENLGGYANAVAVRIMKEDQAAPNPCLKDTKLENIVFENINVKIERSGQPYVMIGAASGDVTIRKLLLKQSDSVACIVLDNCSLQKFTLDDITMVKSNGSEPTDFLVRILNTEVDTVDQIVLKNSNIKLNNSAYGSLFTTIGKGVRYISISNTKVEMPGGSVFSLTGSNTEGTVIKIDNSEIVCNILGALSIKSNVSVVNSSIVASTRTLQLGDGADVRILTMNSGLVLTINGITAARKLSASGDLKAANLLTDFNAARYGDQVFYDRSSDQANKGIYHYNGTTWFKLILEKIEVEVPK